MNQAIFAEMLEEKRMTVLRKFSAPIDKVWAAWTERELLEQWWGPEPYRAVTKSFEFREGGSWHYCMEGPEGDRHWCLVNYLEIETQRYFTSRDCFCDEEANLNPTMPGNHWHNEFSSVGDETRVFITLSFVSVEDMQKLIEMGFKEGFTLGLDQLESLLEK